MQNLFLDTNTLLSFYHYSSDDLEELRKLAVLVKQRSVTLYLPEQVQREFRRNREVKIADALRQLREQKLAFQFPQMSKDYPQYEQMRQLQKDYGNAHKALLEVMERDIRNNCLKADAVIEELIAYASVVACDKHVVSAAKTRHELGDPPGKRDSLGDAVNWEALLVGVPEDEDLVFISGDKDYASQVDPEQFSEFLNAEWERLKNANIYFYKRLSAFLKEHHPDINLEVQAEKDGLIQLLAASESFKQTHDIVGKLSRHTDFTPAQVEGIVSAALGNHQVGWIADDSDVQAFLLRAVEGHEESMDPDQITDFYALFGTESEDPHPVEDDLPF